MLVSFTGGRVQEEGSSEDIVGRPPTEGSAPVSVVMISSLVIVVGLCGVAVSQEFKLVKVVTERKKEEPRVEYHEESERGYPLIVQQPYPIIVEKRIPYNEDRYDRKDSPSVYTSTSDEFGYRPEVVRSPIIFTVSSQSVPSRIPYPLRIQKENWPLPCVGDDPNCLEEKIDNSAKHPIKKKNIYKSVESVKQENIKLNERDVPISSDYEKIEGSVQHKETFQTPILIAIEKPGYKYVKHLVGAGVLPKARQFHVLILEEDDTSDNASHEGLNNTESGQENVSKNLPSEDILSDNKQEEEAEENQQKREVTLEENDTAEGDIISPSTKGKLNDNNESSCEYEMKKIRYVK
ncbi:unnamed protein product [Nezara viridula]|uniref:Uncharacterized protein n=1 Tax=Nezara viridula TaxID=85310 RepID=A0A9P0E1K7_NEZVI|nr:unnamed protein product [Nezara viridula]